MANIDQKLTISELDFSEIKKNLKNFLRDQNEFTDFDFEAAGINVLLDILAYNTHYMAFYNNMIANEMFLDTALMRESVVSHAKMLGYTPRSSVAPRATVNLQITRDVGSASSLTLPRFTKFASAPIGSTSYTFVNRDTVTVDFDPTCNRFCFDDLYIYQGQPLSYTFTYDSTNNPTGSFELPDAGIDTSTLEVVVQESSSSFRKEKFTLSTDSTNTVSTSPVFFLEETRGGKYRIYFGDDVLGKKLTNGNIVIVTYIVTQGSAANKANAFSLIDSVSGYSTSVVYPVTAASGGTGQESIESIRSTSTKAYISNNRGVTKDDIIGLINQRYPYFESVNVWGGEENDPPVYGKVFLAAKPTSGYEITESEKLDVINNVVKPVSVVTVIPEFVDVDYNYLNIYAEVYYDKTKTNRNADSLKALIRNAILAFRDSDLNDFNSKFKMSKMLRNIDDSDLSISYSDAICTIQKRFIPQVGAARNYTLNFGTPLTREDSRYPIYSTPAFRQYDADGVLRTCFMRETTGSSSGIESISVLAAPGTYETRPIIVISGDGVGASAYPIIVNGKITEIVVEKQGASYTTAKATVYATATDLEENNPDTTVDLLVSVEKRYGNLESYFFNENNESVVLNSSAGTIDYVLGKITLTEFDPVSISDPLKIFRINARPERNNFESSRSRIITIDEEDTDSIIIDVRKSE
jgi:hypothetical protein